jgi:hypothetical protein
MTFINNKIPLDEIIVLDRSSHIQDEEFADAYEFAKQIISENNLNTKLTMIPINWDHHARVFNEFKEDWIYLPGCQLCFNQTQRILNYERISYLKETKEKHGNNACFIECHDKPRINLVNGKWYLFYVDAAMYNFIGLGGSELFYFTPDMPKLHLKQTYMSIRYWEYKLNTIPGVTGQLVHDIQSFKNPIMFAEWNKAIGRICINNRSALLGLSKSNIVVSTKKTELVRLLDFTKEYVDDVYKIYNNGLKKITDMTGIDVVGGEMTGLISKQHYIRDFVKLEK